MPRPESNFEYQRRITTALGSMPPIDQDIIELRFIQGREVDVVAEELGVPADIAKHMASSALRSLKDRVYGVPPVQM